MTGPAIWKEKEENGNIWSFSSLSLCDVWVLAPNACASIGENLQALLLW